jgi:hypothetical protein
MRSVLCGDHPLRSFTYDFQLPHNRVLAHGFTHERFVPGLDVLRNQRTCIKHVP